MCVCLCVQEEDGTIKAKKRVEKSKKKTEVTTNGKEIGGNLSRNGKEEKERKRERHTDS